MVTMAPIIAVLDDEPEMRKALCSLAAVLYAIGMLEALRRHAREGGSYLVRALLARDCCWVQDFGLFPENEVRGAGLPEHMMTAKPDCSVFTEAVPERQREKQLKGKDNI